MLASTGLCGYQVALPEAYTGGCNRAWQRKYGTKKCDLSPHHGQNMVSTCPSHGQHMLITELGVVQEYPQGGHMWGSLSEGVVVGTRIQA